MLRSIVVLITVMSGAFLIDQAIKSIFLEGFRWYSSCIDLILVFNKGVAFSMFAFLEEYLKYLQIVLIAALGIYLAMHRDVLLGHASAIGMIAGAALSNIYDRFIHGGVVDYFFWHYGFNFAVFNFADVMIDVGVLCILYRTWKRPNPTK